MVNWPAAHFDVCFAYKITDHGEFERQLIVQPCLKLLHNRIVECAVLIYAGTQVYAHTHTNEYTLRRAHEIEHYAKTHKRARTHIQVHRLQRRDGRRTKNLSQ